MTEDAQLQLWLSVTASVVSLISLVISGLHCACRRSGSGPLDIEADFHVSGPLKREASLSDEPAPEPAPGPAESSRAGP